MLRFSPKASLGARYVSLLPGADEETLADGDFIENTQGALVLENLVGDLITRLGVVLIDKLSYKTVFPARLAGGALMTPAVSRPWRRSRPPSELVESTTDEMLC